MKLRSVKARLCDEIAKKAVDEKKYSAADRWAWRNMLRDLSGRGSGPLPFWARELAREWGITK